MRFLRALALFAWTAQAVAGPIGVADQTTKSIASTTKDAVTEATSEAAGTVFNGEKVPPITELQGHTLEADIKHGYW